MAAGENDEGTAARYITPGASLGTLRRVAADCRACDLWSRATQTVFGVGPAPATLMCVGEVPGDQEDKAGAPFVGPAGALLDAALAAAGVDRSTVYLTNVVKHFKWERGAHSARRIHKKPNAVEIRACQPWLDAEIARVRPRVLVCLGATAAQALLGHTFRVTANRGKPVSSPLAETVIATVHPSSILRAPDPKAREEAERAFMADIRVVAAHI
jgi:uracil-DNA glycosylase